MIISEGKMDTVWLEWNKIVNAIKTTQEHKHDRQIYEVNRVMERATRKYMPTVCGEHKYKCSHCKAVWTHKANYCPHCGVVLDWGN